MSPVPESFEILIGGGDHADVHAHSPGSPPQVRIESDAAAERNRWPRNRCSASVSDRLIRICNTSLLLTAISFDFAKNVVVAHTKTAFASVV